MCSKWQSCFSFPTYTCPGRSSTFFNSDILRDWIRGRNRGNRVFENSDPFVSKNIRIEKRKNKNVRIEGIIVTTIASTYSPYYVSNTVQSSQWPNEVVTIIIPSLQIRKLRHSEVKWFPRILELVSDRILIMKPAVQLWSLASWPLPYRASHRERSSDKL